MSDRGSRARRYLPTVASRFALDTAVNALAEGLYQAEIRPEWRVERPNGGYVAAILLRAVTAEIGDPDRSPRSVAIHYLRPPEDGPVEVAVTVERTGRSMSAVSARLTQQGKVVALALVAAGTERDGYRLDDAPAPDVPAPEDCALAPPPPFRIRIREQFEIRPAIGPPAFTGGNEAVTGGWLRLRDPEPTEAHVLVQIADAWIPAIFGVTSERLGVPTVDLTVHLRQAVLPEDDGWVLVRFRTRLAAAGYLEEDGEIWDRAGRLLAHSRQLAVIL